MLWVLKRTVSMRRFFWAPKHMIKLMDKKFITIERKLFLLNWPYVMQVNLKCKPLWNDAICQQLDQNRI